MSGECPLCGNHDLDCTCLAGVSPDDVGEANELVDSFRRMLALWVIGRSDSPPSWLACSALHAVVEMSLCFFKEEDLRKVVENSIRLIKSGRSVDLDD